jgi:hypothetical protein
LRCENYYYCFDVGKEGQLLLIKDNSCYSSLKVTGNHEKFVFLNSCIYNWGPMAILMPNKRLILDFKFEGSQISEKYWGEVGKGKRADVDLEVRKRSYIFLMKQVPV